MRSLLVPALFVLGCTMAPTGSDGPANATPPVGDTVGERMRTVVAAHGSAVVTVEMVLKENLSMGGLAFGNNQSESVSETTATVISPDGLMVTSLSSTDPGGMFQEMFSMFGGDFGLEMNFDTQVKEVTIVYGSGEEVPGRFVLRDRDLDLAFIRPDEKPSEPLPYVSMSDDASLQQFDQVMIVKRMGKVADRAVSGDLMRVASVLETPRLYYVLSDAAGGGRNSGMGLPAFDLDGRFVGMTILRRLKLSAAGGLSLSSLSGIQNNMAMAIVPAADIQESADQAPGYDEEAGGDAGEAAAEPELDDTSDDESIED